MKTSRAILNDRSKKKKSTFHKLCTYENPIPHFESEEIHGYEYSHTRTPAQQLVFHKEEIKPTPISLPTPPASPEFWGTSLHKWYQKKPLFTLTAKGQVKRLEKYLQIQKTIEMCKKEHEFQVQTENMKKAYVDFEFREHQPLLYEDKDICCVCPCNSSRKYDIDYIPVDYISCSSPKPKFCICTRNDEDKTFEVPFEMKQDGIEDETEDGNSQYPITNMNPTTGFVEEEIIIPTKIIKQGKKEPEDRGIYKIIVKNKETPEIPNAKHMMKIYDNQNFEQNERVQYMSEESNTFNEMPNFKENDCKTYQSRSARSLKNYCSCCQHCRSGGSREFHSNNYKRKYDLNKNEIF